METLIQKVLENLKNEDITSLKFITPSKRSVLFLKKEIIKLLDGDSFLPNIITIEELMCEVSEMEKIDNISLLFEFYDAYLEVERENAENFENVAKWANVFLNDINEINLHVEFPKKIFQYIIEAEKIENWDPSRNSEIVKNFVGYWEKAYLYYEILNKNLIQKKIGYQGLVFRKAIEEIDKKLLDEKLIFIGFNALTYCEEFLIKKLLLENRAKIFWDSDEYYLNDIHHEAGFFIRKYKKWGYYNTHEFLFKEKYLDKKKNISIYEMNGNMNQTLCVNNILNNRIDIKNINTSNTAIVLPDENMLIPLINILPEVIEDINITMEFPIKNTSIAQFFKNIFQIHLNKKKLNIEGDFFYCRDIISFFKNSFFQKILNKKLKIIDKINSLNETIISKNKLILIFNEVGEEFWMEKIFGNIKNSSVDMAEVIVEFIEKINDKKGNNFSDIENEYIYHFSKIFYRIKNILQKNKLEFDLEFMSLLYGQILNQETIPFVGEPLGGIQIMGMLETRLLDFENIIITSVNEGILPEGKTDNSYIPYDIKKEFNIPTYDDRDAIFSYHFYRLLQRAKNVFLIYNSKESSLGVGEESRFIKQILFELKDNYNIEINCPSFESISIGANKEIEVYKTDEMLEKLKEKLEMGISPSAINLYLRDSMEFYKKYILEIEEREKRQEYISQATMGTIIHKTIEDLYRGYLNKNITKNDVEVFEKDYYKFMIKNIEKEYKGGNYNKGKNLLILETMDFFMKRFLKREKLEVEGSKIFVKNIEKEIVKNFKVDGLDIKLKGKIDRIDNKNGIDRIIDYKTGTNVSTRDIDIKKIEEIDVEKLRNKPKLLQILFYSYLYENETDDFICGIYSFKEDRYYFSYKKDDYSAKFEENLQKIILEMLDKKIPFKYSLKDIFEY